MVEDAMAAIAVALAIALRVGWVLGVPTRPVGDFAMYWESAAHLVAHGRLDAEFVYMPGHVFLLAAVQVLGGGLLAAKIVGAVAAGLGAGLIYGITARLWDARAAIAASVLYALWPAGIAVSSVTGTDMPAAVALLGAIYCLVRWGDNPRVFGAAMGLGAYLRAVALPLTMAGAFFYWSCGLPFRVVVRRTVLACAAAALVLSPWIVRNRLRYGEWFATDSHGGLTALVGANPNSEGTYSRSLNLIFHRVTGYTLLAEPHRDADRAAYVLARDWTRFEPAYAAGLVIKKGERLLDNERGLLYWPLYRAGVLDDARRAWFVRWRGAIENVVDLFWCGLVVAGVAGLGIAVARRRWVALALLPHQMVLVAIYALYFAEVRYHLPIAALLFPSAGGAVVWLCDRVKVFAVAPSVVPGVRREALVAGACVTAIFVGWPLVLACGAGLRARHRFAVHVCQIAGQARACQWRSWAGADLRGVHDGVGLALTGDRSGTAILELPLPAGTYELQSRVDLAPIPPIDRVPSGEVALFTGAQEPFAHVPLAALDDASRRGTTVPLAGTVTHAGGTLRLSLAITGTPVPAPTRVWLVDLRIIPAGP